MKKENGIEKGFPYEDILDLPHHTSSRHPRMVPENRAAQFLPFAALTGYEDAVRETGRLTERRIELDEDQKMLLDHQIQMGQEHTITYFVPDTRKEGGSYQTITGKIKRLDQQAGTLLLTDGTRVALQDILELKSAEDPF